jgi:hypothetical protein
MEEKPLTKKQLEQLGFTVTEKQLKTKTKVEIEYAPLMDNYIGMFYHYPSFQEIVDRIVSNAKRDAREEIKENITRTLFQ